MELNEAVIREPLRRFIAERSGATEVRIESLHRLGGGAVQEIWSIDANVDATPLGLVMKASSASAGVPDSITREQEFMVLRAAHTVGVTVPEPLWVCTDRTIIGRDFFIMREVKGVAAGHLLVRDSSLGDALVERLGRELAYIHSIYPNGSELDFLRRPQSTPAQHSIDRYRSWLSYMELPYPGLEWCLCWLDAHAPRAPFRLTLIHHDFRTGNYMVDAGKLTGILDWEFCEWGDIHEDIAWFCARCWRFGACDKEAGGIGSRETFYRSYEEASGRTIERDIIPYWEVMAHVRWATIAIQQGQRHCSGVDRSLELALTGRMTAELELQALLMVEEMSDA
ncbi:MAG: phosphotransferase family protein [Gammaproteobacteria bacterium]|nr:phosphotransferase family protein [Gammaproteobacteria bacterium]